MPNAPCPQVSRLPVSRLPCGLVLGYPCDAASAAAYGRLPEWPKGAVCKTVGSAYVGSNPTPATSFRRSEPVTLNCVTGFSAQNERLRKPSALFRGLCVGRVRPSPGLRGYRVRYRLTCGNTSGCGCPHAMLRAGQARRPWAVGGTGDWFAYI